MTQPGSVSSGLCFERTHHGHQLAERTGLLRRITAPQLEYLSPGGKFALPQTLYLADITGEHMRSTR
jgi:hypothetical protein